MTRPDRDTWPDLMVSRFMRGGIAYYWSVPDWAKKAGCELPAESLGMDYGAAKQRCDAILNPSYESWRQHRQAIPPRIPSIERVAEPVEGHQKPATERGSFSWMVEVYQASPKFTELPSETRRSYLRAINLVAKYQLKDDRQFGILPLIDMTPGVADGLFAKLKVRRDGTLRMRQAVLSMRVCQRAWTVAYRRYPTLVPSANPFAKMGLGYRAKPTRPATYRELLRFVRAADEAGDVSIGTAAMIAYFWLQRQTDILQRLSWDDYRPRGQPIVQILHHKTHELIEIPLIDDDGTQLWPELTDRLDHALRRGPLIVTRDHPDRTRKCFLPWKEDYFRHRVAAIRLTAGIDNAVKFMGLRHGGSTEGANADLSDAQLRALSGHRSANMTVVYARNTMRQRRDGARKRRDSRSSAMDDLKF